MTRYYYDCEFIDDGKTIDLISIGIVCEDGRELYLQSVEFDEDKASDWVKENVLRNLPLCPCCGHQCNHVDQPMGKCRSKACMWRTRAQIKIEILEFMDIEKYGKPELWSYYGAYDHVAFCQLFGAMMDLPPGYPMLTYDLRQWLDMYDLRYIRQPDDSPHNALEDARWVARTYKLCSKEMDLGWTPEQLDELQAIWNSLVESNGGQNAVITTIDLKGILIEKGMLKDE